MLEMTRNYLRDLADEIRECEDGQTVNKAMRIRLPVNSNRLMAITAKPIKRQQNRQKLSVSERGRVREVKSKASRLLCALFRIFEKL